MKKIRVFSRLLIVAISLMIIPISALAEDYKAKIEAAGHKYDVEHFYRAVYGNNSAIAKLFVQAGIDVNHRGGWDQTPVLVLAARNNDKQLLQLMLDKGVDVNARGARNGSALYHVAANGHGDLVKAFVEKGFDMEKGGMAALHGAMKFNQVEVLELLLQRWPKVYQDKFPQALYLAIKGGSSVAVVKALLKNGADPNVTYKGFHPLVRAAETGGRDEKRSELVRVLLDHGADVNATDSFKMTSIMRAAQGGFPLTVKTLIAKGGDVNLVDERGRTALIWAASSRRLDAVSTLLSKGADRNIMDQNGHTALSYANQKSWEEGIKILSE